MDKDFIISELLKRISVLELELTQLKKYQTHSEVLKELSFMLELKVLFLLQERITKISLTNFTLPLMVIISLRKI